MRNNTLKSQQETIRKAQQALRTYKLWKECRTKASYFKKQEVEDYIFHLGIIFTTTELGKAANLAQKFRKYFIKILKYEFKEEPKKAIITDLTKEKTPRSILLEIEEIRRKRKKLEKKRK